MCSPVQQGLSQLRLQEAPPGGPGPPHVQAPARLIVVWRGGALEVSRWPLIILLILLLFLHQLHVPWSDQSRALSLVQEAEQSSQVGCEVNDSYSV